MQAPLSKAGRIYAGKIGTNPVQYWCQRNYAFVSAAPHWIGSTAPYGGVGLDGVAAVGDQDADPKTRADLKPVGRYEGPTPSSNSLSDVAGYYYNTDLRPSGGTCNVGVGGSDVCKDGLSAKGQDVASHQHMTTYTFGFGVYGSLQYRPDYYDNLTAVGDFKEIVDGTKNWPVPPVPADTMADKFYDDLWHAAVNGGGSYWNAYDANTLANGFAKYLNSLQTVAGAGAAASTSNLEPVVGDNLAFTADYRTVSWDGDIQGRTIDLDTGSLSVIPLWSAKAGLATKVAGATDTRQIHTFHNPASPTADKLRPFSTGTDGFSAAELTAWFDPVTKLAQYPILTAAQKANATPAKLVAFLRGQFGNEMQDGNPVDQQVFRDRETTLGDIVNAKPVYVRVPPFTYAENDFMTWKNSVKIKGRTGVVYVGANDGMLHAFNASSGEELWSYVPALVLPNIAKLADNTYALNHNYFVDGSPTAADIYDGSNWKTILVAGLNAGGRGYYALDVTDPIKPQALWEYSDPNLGLTFGNPVVGKLKDGTWVVIFGSGYNNVSPGDGVGRLYILNANTGTLIRTISTGEGDTTTPSGLSRVSGWVEKGMVDNTIERVYGGDLNGNMWRFDINNSIDESAPGYDAFKLGQFKIGTTPQPITAMPELGVVKDSVVGGSHTVVFFGTGRLLGKTDLGDTSQQTIYAIKDNLKWGPKDGIGDARGAPSCTLVAQEILVQSKTERSTTSNPVDWSTGCGWYMDLNPKDETPGERVNVDPVLQGSVLAIATNVPSNDVCEAGGASWLYMLDYKQGSYVVTETSKTAGRLLGNALTVGISTFRLPNGKIVTNATLANAQRPTTGNPSMGSGAGGGKRVSWRELYSR